MSEPRPLIIPGLPGCFQCPLHETRNRVVTGFGNWPARIMAVGEAPGGEEERAKIPRPFIGTSGQLFRRMLGEAGIQLDDVFMTNTVHCRPPQNRDPKPLEIRRCAPWLDTEIGIVDPDIILCLGSKAYKRFLPDEESSITAIRGHFFEREIEGRKRWIVPMVHPAFVMRNVQTWRAPFIDDLRKVRKLMDTGEIERPPAFTKTKSSWEDLVEAAYSVDKFGFDLEFDGPHDLKGFPTPRKADIVGVGIATEPGVSYYYPCPDHEDLLSKIGDLKDVLESKEVIKVVSNVKAEKHVLRRYGIEIENYRDTMLEAWLLGQISNIDLPLNLKDTWQRMFGTEMMRINEVIGKGKTARGMREATEDDEEAVIEYAAQDPDASLRIHMVLIKEIEQRGLEELYLDVELPFARIITDMEERGFAFDPTRLEESKDILEAEIISKRIKLATQVLPFVADLPRNIIHDQARSYLGGMNKPRVKHILERYHYYDVEDKTKDQLIADFIRYSEAETVEDFVADSFNPNSNDQTKLILFGADGKGNAIEDPPRSLSTDKVTLAEYAGIPVVPPILSYRNTQKLLGTYIYGLPKHLDNGRIHSSISQVGTETGRISSSNPNLTNIPARRRGDIESGIDPKKIRNAFIATPGNIISCFDFAQIEMRVQADLSDCYDMKQLFLTGGDVHGNTTEKIYGTTYAEVMAKFGPELGPGTWNNYRYLAKTIGFGVLFGLTPEGLIARTPELDLTIQMARDFINAFFLAYPEILAWQLQQKDFVRRYGFNETKLRRRRYYPEHKAANRAIVEKVLRECINFPIQGGAADIFKIAVLEVDKALKKYNLLSVMINQVHDEIVMEGPESELNTLAEVVPPVMSAVGARFNMEIPLPVDYEYGYSWGELTEYKLN